VPGTVTEPRTAAAVVVVGVEDPVESDGRRSRPDLTAQIHVAIADERRRRVARDAWTVCTTHVAHCVYNLPLKPNSIALASSELVRSRNLAYHLAC